LNAIVFVVSTIFLLPGIILAIPAHELAHVYAARAAGDETPRRQGYMRSWRNWFSPYGVVAIIFLRVGWGEEPPVNEYRLPGIGGKLMYALAGPVANLIVAIPFGIAARLLIATNGQFDPTTWVQPPIYDLEYVLYAIFFINLAMFAFNLLPIPGLDGWRVIEALFRGFRPKFFFDAGVRRREIWAVCAVVIFLSYFIGLNVLGWVMSPFFHPASALIMGACTAYPGLNGSLAPCLP
jgi:Zn-dependent protease